MKLQETSKGEIVEFDEEKGYLLQDDDLIRIGKIKFYITHKHKFNVDERYWEFTGEDKILTENKLEYTCKICLESTCTPEDPMINCCLCKGTQGLIHLSCCRTWITSKLIVFEEINVFTYIWRNYFCEICKQPYKMLVRNPKINEVLWLVKFLDNDDEYFKSKFNNFLIMESVPSKDAYHKIVHIVRNLYLDEVDIK